MPAIVQRTIVPLDLQNNPSVVFVYEDSDRGVPAKTPNSVGIRLMEHTGIPWSDQYYEYNVAKLDEDFAVVSKLLRAGVSVVFPVELGNDLAQHAKRTHEYFLGKLSLVFDYNQRDLERLLSIMGES